MKQTITIYRDGVYSGEGFLTGGEISGCPAVLGPDQDASDATYELIADAIDGGDDSVSRPDGEYTWDLSDEEVAKPSQCAYCHIDLPAEDRLTVPSPSDDAEWERLAPQHGPGCEWVATRAHRIDG
jgi:hypothetical protein